MMNYSSNTRPPGGGKGSFSGGGKPMGSSGRPMDTPRSTVADLNTNDILFGERLDGDLFNGVALKVAESLAGSNKKFNKPSQLRKFYDEICLWSEKVEGDEERFKQNEPFIRMMNAKAAYAKGRELVDDNFVKLLNHGISQVKSAETMRHFKLFMEAVMGFYKEKRPKDS